MTPESWIAIVAQTLIIVFVVIGAFFKISQRVTRLEIRVDHIDKCVDKQGVKVDGISRSVARMEGSTAQPVQNGAV